MIGPDPRGPLEERDHAVLDEVRRFWELADPPPPGLAELAVFAIQLAGPDTDILRAGDRQLLAGARGDERSRSITFDGVRLTAVVTLTPATDGSVRLDGWISPPSALPIELRTAGGTLSTTADERGRFTFERVGRGVVQLLVHDNGTTMTPSMEV